MEEILISAGFGILGGVVRSMVMAWKNFRYGRVSSGGFLFYTFALIFMGAFSGIVLGFGKVLSFLAGYASLDLMDGYYKSFKGKKIKFA